MYLRATAGGHTSRMSQKSDDGVYGCCIVHGHECSGATTVVMDEKIDDGGGGGGGSNKNAPVTQKRHHFHSWQVLLSTWDPKKLESMHQEPD